MSISNYESAISEALVYWPKMNQLKGRYKQKIKINNYYIRNYQYFFLVVETK